MNLKCSVRWLRFDLRQALKGQCASQMLNKNLKLNNYKLYIDVFFQLS